MYQSLGNLVSRIWPVLLVLWIVVLLGLRAITPQWEDVVSDGEFRYLPNDVLSRQAEELFSSAFTKDLLGSSVIVVVRREGGDTGLTDKDRAFIEETLKPALEKIAEEEGSPKAFVGERADSEAADDDSSASTPRLIDGIRTFKDREIGHLLESEDNRASLVLVEFTTEFLEYRNGPAIEKIEQLVGKGGTLYQTKDFPHGLHIVLSGSATVGRDMKKAARESASATESWTVILVVILLILIYRAPLLAFIPLVTVGVAVTISIRILSLMAEQGWIELFNGIEVYVTVVLYGAGVDYCVFLMARYKEELDQGVPYKEALANSVGKVGSALAASAGTTMCGIGMMMFAEFGKFAQAGLAMSLSLVFVLAASLTFTPSLLRLFGRWAFWPKMQSERIPSGGNWFSPTYFLSRLLEVNLFPGIWDKIGSVLLRKPGTVWLACVALMTPFVVIALLCFNNLSFGLLSELPSDTPSVVGAKAVQNHFPAGATGPTTVLLANQNIDFSDSDTRDVVGKLTERLAARREELGIADIRSVSHPEGVTEKADRIAKEWEEGYEGLSVFQRSARTTHREKNILEYYVSDKEEMENHVTRIDVVFQEDPFSRNSIDQVDQLETAFRELIPKELAEGAEIGVIGSTASIRDLKTVTGRDRIRIDILVLISVYLVLLLLLRKPATSAYLIVSVFFSYLVTVGVAFAFFWAIDPSGFTGLDWKVPTFLFTILIAVGEDYNIYLITRIEEEQKQHGMIEGVTVALSKTGGIISSCGFIMAGTFASLMAGSLAGMVQLGFALAFGVLLDTFVVRPVIVPAYLIMLHQGRFGRFGKFLGAGAASTIVGEAASQKYAHDV